ncbi:MAG: SPFH domain-containing protein [Phycisphaerae bacterium]
MAMNTDTPTAAERRGGGGTNPPRRPIGFDPEALGPAARFGWLLLLVLLIPLGVMYWWLVQRVEVPANHILLLTRKVGESLPAQAETADQYVLYPGLLAALGEPPGSTRYKGIIYEPVAEGRYFFDPFFWERVVVPATIIEPEEVGIVIRKYGRALPAGRTVATAPDERGPLAEVLRPGRYNLNPHAYDVKRAKPVVIPPGHVGVQTLYAGEEGASTNEYLAAEGQRGVQPVALPPGMYYNNPYARRIDVIDVRSHTIDMHGDDAIRFPSNDSFDILIDCTVEYAIRQDLAPFVMVAIGDHDDIREKLILPYARSLCRIEGSKLLARDFISGDTRRAFQEKVFEGLREQSFSQGIEIRATLIRRIVPPAAIAEPISDRQVAGQQIKQYENEIKVAEAEAKLVEQQEMQKQNQAIGQAQREVVTVTVEAEQRKAVALTNAAQRLEVAKLELEAARQNAAAMIARGQAEAEVRLLQFEAEARPLRDAIAAFGDGETYAQFFFYQKLAPAVKSVLASTDGAFAEIFRNLSSTAPAPPRPRLEREPVRGASPPPRTSDGAANSVSSPPAASNNGATNAGGTP